MLGAIIGDVLGSYYEFRPCKREDIPLFLEKSQFTDDTVMTLAVALSVMGGYADDELTREELIKNMHAIGSQYYKRGYGVRFIQWLLKKSTEPYNSFGNGSAMRVSSVAWAYQTLEDVQKFAKISAEITHNHPEGIKGAVATAVAIFMARQGKTKQEIKDYIETQYEYNLSRSLSEVRKTYRFDETCQGSVPEAILCFLESENFEDAIRKAISLGGDSDTQATIAGSIAEAFYREIPTELINFSLAKLDYNLMIILATWQAWLQDTVMDSTELYIPQYELNIE